MKVKICGITNSEDALMVSKQGADAIGFIFSPRSPRYLSRKTAQKIIRSLDPFVVKVGVFLDEEKQKVLDIAHELNLEVLQFHGKETPAYCRFFKPKFKVIKTLFPQDSPYKPNIHRYAADAFLFDVKYEEKLKGTKRLSGTALKEISRLIKEGVRVIISGGLSPSNIAGIKRLNPYGVDVAGGVEKFVGRKDERLIKMFMEKAQ